MKKRVAKYKLEVAEDSLDFPEGCTISRYMIQRFNEFIHDKLSTHA